MTGNTPAVTLVPCQVTTKCLRLVLIASFFTCSVFFIYFGPGEYFQQQATLPKSSISVSWWMRLFKDDEQDHDSTPKLILGWTNRFSEANWLPPLQELRCPISSCEITYDHNRLAQSSAVLMHLRSINMDNLPDPEIPGPIWVLVNRESPVNTPVEVVKKLNGKVHWTVSYRPDSTLYFPYGEIAKRTEPVYAIPDVNTDQNLICWLVSNCHTSSMREVYVEEMSRHTPIKIYGKCHDKMCPRNTAEECYKWLAQRCKFYLSFENSICQDYVTEKLFLALSNNMVPVVMGGANYSRLLPQNSFINAADFAGPRQLAEFLQTLGNDTERYESYFTWKREYVSVKDDYRWLCDLCRKLHDTQRNWVKPHKDLVSWWFTGCKDWKRLLSNSSL